MNSAAPTRWQQLDALFEAVLELAPDQRAAFLAASGQDASIVQEVEALVGSHAVAEAALGESATEFASPLMAGLRSELHAQQAPLAAGDRIGPYRVIREVGRGGMGAVYLAERADDEYRRRVAVKLVKRGLDTDEVLQRFRYERQILASLDHPNIAQLYDGGASDDGRPYLVMEYVDGQPIDAYCDAHRLGIEQRLALFRTACLAVQYAHQNLVVHRDVKPSNILVTGDGTVKLLDFGIAKLLGDETSDDTPATRTGMRVLTPEYAAPEQLSGAPVTTASDVYALGVVLHQLLTGQRPGAAGNQLPSAVAARTAPDAGRALRGDLDTIVLKALEPDPARRYQSPQRIVDDLDRRREGRPITARRSTVAYRSARFVRRNRAAVGAAIVVVLLLAAMAIVASLRVRRQRDAARLEAAKAQATTDFLKGLFEGAGPDIAKGDTLNVFDLLERGTAGVDSLAGQPEVQAELLTTLGEVYRELGDYTRSRAATGRALALERTGGARTLLLARTLGVLGFLHYQLDHADSSYALHGEALAIRRALLPPDDQLVLTSMNDMAVAASANNRLDDALALHRELLARRLRLFGDTNWYTTASRNNYGMALWRTGDSTGAERELREVLRVRRLTLGANNQDVAVSLNNLGKLLGDRGRYAEAESLHREALAIRMRVHGPDHPRTGTTAYNLAYVLHKVGKLAEAESLYLAAAGIDRKRFGAEHRSVAADLERAGAVMRDRGNCDGATRTLTEAARILSLSPEPTPARARVDSALKACS